MPASIQFPRSCILAGGLGTRIRSVSGERPKALLQVGRSTVLGWILCWLESQGCREVVLCLGFGAEAVQAYVRQFPTRLKCFYSVEPSPVGTAGALRWALPLLEEQVLVVNGDTIFRTDLKPLFELHRAQSSGVTMALAQVPDARRFGAVHLDRAKRVVDFGEKQQSGHPGWVNAGIYLMDRNLLTRIVPPGQCSLEYDVFPKIVSQGLPFYALPLEGRFFDVGAVEGYQEAIRYFEAQPSSV